MAVGGGEGGKFWLEQHASSSAAWLGKEPAEAPAGVISKTEAKKRRRQAIVKNIASIKTLFGPIVHLLKLKRDDMVEGVKAAGSFQKWMNPGGTIDELEDTLTGVDADEEMDANMNIWRAFCRQT